MTILYVGADDSNHAGTTKGEVIVATFSQNPKDSIVTEFKNGRNIGALENWLKEDGVDYRFLLLTKEKYRSNYSNLPYSVPFLIRSYLNDNLIYLDQLKMYLDGRLEKRDKSRLVEEFFHLADQVIVSNFIKKRTQAGKNRKRNQKRTIKRPICPRVTYMADVLAHRLFSSYPLEEILTHKKLVQIP